MSGSILCYVVDCRIVKVCATSCETTNTSGNLNVLSVYRSEIRLKRKTIFLEEVVNKVNVLSMSFSPQLLTGSYNVLRV